MEEKAEALFGGSNLGYLATLMGGGAPQLSPVWVDYEGGHVLVNTAEGRVKHRNVLRDPRVAVSVAGRGNDLDAASVRGSVVGMLPDPDYAHADKLTRRYMGLDAYPFRRPGERRVVLKIRPDRVFVMPELRPAGP